MTLIQFKKKDTGTAAQHRSFSREDVEAVNSLYRSFLEHGVARDYKMNFSDDHLSFDFYFSALDNAPTYTLHIYMNDDGGFDYEARTKEGLQIDRRASLKPVIKALEEFGLKNKPLNVDWAKYAVYDLPRQTTKAAKWPNGGAFKQCPRIPKSTKRRASQDSQEDAQKDDTPRRSAIILPFPNPRQP